MPPTTRLNRFLAQAGVASRRGADELIAAGRVAINGRRVADAGRQVGNGQRVTVDGRPVRAERLVYLILHKPAGVVSTVSDPQGWPTVRELVRVRERVFPVGRLDVTTTGLVLMTNDGELAARLLHPSAGVWKTYRARVAGAVGIEAVRALRGGVELDDGRTAPARVRVVGRGPTGSTIEIAIHEGRNRQVRRMCEAVGHPCTSLARTGFGPLVLGRLAAGRSRPLTEEELASLRGVPKAPF